MATSTGNEALRTPPTASGGYLFGVPIGELGWFATLLMGATSGFVAFFAATFCGIVGVAIYNATTHRAADFSLSYKWVGLPAGLVVMFVALSYLGTLWVKRQMRRAS